MAAHIATRVPEHMKAIQVTLFAEKDNLSFVEDAARPQIRADSNDILVRVLACALNPGDCRVMSGSVSLVMKPKRFPYTLGMDVCGLVEEVGTRCMSLAKGDRVAVVLEPLATSGGLAEYLVCDAKQATRVPADLDTTHAASLPVAGTTALQAVKDARVRFGSKILVLGASGGVGSLVVQIARAHGASFIAATSTNENLVRELGADQVIDYRTTKWWEELESKVELDAIIDCVGCDESWRNCSRSLARGGRYVAVVDAPDTQLRTFMDLLRFGGKILRRVLSPFTPTYRLVSCFPSGQDVSAVMDLVAHKRVHAVLDPSSPLPFSLAGAQQAVGLQRSQRARGKLVFVISSS